MATQVPPPPLPQLATPGAVQPPNVQAAGTASASNGHGFTQSQLNVLRNQILAFKRFTVSVAALPTYTKLCIVQLKAFLSRRAGLYTLLHPLSKCCLVVLCCSAA